MYVISELSQETEERTRGVPLRELPSKYLPKVSKYSATFDCETGNRRKVLPRSG